MERLSSDNGARDYLENAEVGGLNIPRSAQTKKQIETYEEDNYRSGHIDLNVPYDDHIIYLNILEHMNINKLTELIITYQQIANSSTSSDDELIDSANAIPFYLYDNGYDAEQNDELMDYLLRATDKEAANYWLNNFLPKFKQTNK